MIKRTLQEIANFFDMAVTVDRDGSVFMHPVILICSSSNWYNHGDDIFIVVSDIVNYSGDWRESLTLPDSWPKEPPLKEGELVYGSNNSGPYVMTYDRMINAAWYRSPTEAEWKVLKGE